jgi:hypothetical protein
MKSYAMPMLVPITGYVYFIQIDRIGPIKIGFTKDLGKRLMGLQVSSPYPLRILCLFPGNENMEKEIHDSYREMRMEGEWFLPHPFILKEIDCFKEINNKNGFIEPIPEYDIDNGVDTHEEYFGHVDYSKGYFHWNDFFASPEYQLFKREKNKDIRNKYLDKFTDFYRKEINEESLPGSL